MSKTNTRVQFEEEVNEIPVPYGDLKSQGGSVPDKTTRYGSWLRRNDPMQFNVGYQEWCRAK